MKTTILCMSAVAILFTTGCGNTDNYGNEYELRISSAFSANEQVSIVNAAKDGWEHATEGKLVLHPVIADSGCKDEHCVYIVPSNKKEIKGLSPAASDTTIGLTLRKHSLDQSTIYIAVEITKENLVFFTNVVKHEMGHSFGLDHAESGIMRTHVDFKHTDMGVMCADVVQYHDLRLESTSEKLCNIKDQ